MMMMMRITWTPVLNCVEILYDDGGDDDDNNDADKDDDDDDDDYDNDDKEEEEKERDDDDDDDDHIGLRSDLSCVEILGQLTSEL